MLDFLRVLLLLRLGLGIDLFHLALAIKLLEGMLWAMVMDLLLHRLDLLDRY